MHDQQLDMMGMDEVDLDTILANLDQMESDPRLWPKTLADLMAVVQQQICRSQSLPKEKAYPVARDIIAALAHYMGGRQMYLPRDDRLKRAFRDIQIYQAFDGRNHQALAEQHGLTTMQIYAILAEQKKLHIGRVQQSLFS